MSKLIEANFVRLIKDKILWICIILMALMAGFMLYTCYRNGSMTEAGVAIDGGFFLEMQFIGVMIAAFCSMFVGTEYNDGTIRNKIVVGNKRSAIYFANFIAVSIAGIMVELGYLLVYAGIGMPLFGVRNTTWKDFGFSLLISILLIVAFSSICTMLSMCIQNRTIVMCVTIIGVFLLLFGAIYLFSSLSQPPVWESYLIQDEAGNITTMPEEVNTQYISGIKREIYTFLFDLNPAGQGFQLAQGITSANWWLPVYSLMISIGTTIAGLAIFHKKDIK